VLTSKPAAIRPFLEIFSSVTVEEKMIPSPIQNVGMGVNHQRMESPRSAVDGMFWRTKITIGMIPPSKKWMNRVMICATVSEVKKNAVMYVKGTIASGYSMSSTQTPSYYRSKMTERSTMTMIGKYVFTMSDIKLEIQ